MLQTLLGVLMPALPLTIDMRGKTIFVAGGGKVALRKVRTLMSAGATIRVAAPEPCRELVAFAEQGDIYLKQECFCPNDLNETFLAIAATDNPLVNKEIAEECKARQILVCVVDDPGQGDCSFPAVLRRGELEISVSTGGACPALAVEVRDLLSEIIGDEFRDITRRMAVEREKLLTEEASSTYNKEVLRTRAKQMIKGIAEYKDLL